MKNTIKKTKTIEIEYDTYEWDDLNRKGQLIALGKILHEFFMVQSDMLRSDNERRGTACESDLIRDICTLPNEDCSGLIELDSDCFKK